MALIAVTTAGGGLISGADCTEYFIKFSSSGSRKLRIKSAVISIQDPCLVRSSKLPRFLACLTMSNVIVRCGALARSRRSMSESEHPRPASNNRMVSIVGFKCVLSARTRLQVRIADSEYPDPVIN